MEWSRALKILGWFFITAFFLSLLLEGMIGKIQEGNVAVISIEGPIVIKKSDYFSEQAASDRIIKAIDEAEQDPTIHAILFEINSPGGSAVASDEIAERIKKTNKTTIAVIREIGTSGAYWIASATDHIIANRMSITGSIGVISSYLGFDKFLKEYNITYHRLVSGKFKDMGSPFKNLTFEEEEKFNEKLQMIHQYFIDAVAENRNLPREKVKGIATGEFFLGIEAKKLGLIDELGNKDTAQRWLAKELNETITLREPKEEEPSLLTLLFHSFQRWKPTLEQAPKIIT